jgi:hypothetical protein
MKYPRSQASRDTWRFLTSALLGLLAPVLLIVILPDTWYWSEIIEEFVKAGILVVGGGLYFALRSRILLAFLIGLCFGISETVLYSSQFIAIGSVVKVLLVRFFLVIPMHMATAAIPALSISSSRWLFPVGIGVAIGLHILFNMVIGSLL